MGARAEAVITGLPNVQMIACKLCGVLLWDIDAHYAHAHTDQSDGHKAEMIGACHSTTPHDGHDWQYSDTGYVECPGVPNQSNGES